MPKIAITGSNGFIGSRLYELFKKDKNYQVYKDEKNKNILDLRKEELKSLEFIIYCAYKFAAPKDYNINKLKNLLEKISDNNTKVIYMSTCNIRDTNITDYTKDKKQCEEIIKKFGHNIIRLPTIIEIKNNNILMGGKGAALEKIFKFEKYFGFVPIIGDGNYTHNFCLIEDLKKILKNMTSGKISEQIVIIKNSNQLSFKVLLIRIFQIRGIKIKIISIPFNIFNLILKVLKILNFKINFGQDNLIELINDDDDSKESKKFILKNFNYKTIQ